MEGEKKPKTENGYRHIPKIDFDPCSGKFHRYSYGANSVTGWRPGQEDRYDCIPSPNFTGNMSYFGVYDGHGGQDISYYLKSKLHSFIKSQLSKTGDVNHSIYRGFALCDTAVRNLTLEEISELKEALPQEFSFEEILTKKPGDKSKGNSAVFWYSIENEVCREVFRMKLDAKAEAIANGTWVEPPPSEEREDHPYVGLIPGSTATVLIFTDNFIYAGNVGHSRCVASINGKAKCLTHDYQPHHEMERKRIEEAGYKVVGERIHSRLNMSRCFGAFAFKRSKRFKDDTLQAVTVEPFLCSIENDNALDFIVIASDGIWNSVGNETVLEFVRQRLHFNVPLQKICQQLFDCILTNKNVKEGFDNMTMIIIKNDSKVIKPLHPLKFQTVVKNTKTDEKKETKTDEKKETKTDEKKETKTEEKKETKTNEKKKTKTYKLPTKIQPKRGAKKTDMQLEAPKPKKLRK